MLKLCSISNSINREAVKILKEKEISVDVWKGEKSPTKDELKRLIQIYDILMIGVKEKITKDMITEIRSPKIIGTLSIGLDHIDEQCLRSNFIHVINCPTANTISVAEHIFALLLEASKRIQEANELVIQGKGNRKLLSTKPNEITGKTIGLIGAGNISRKIVDMANIFQMPILCYTQHPDNHLDLKEKGVKFICLDEVLQNSDIINISIPLTNQTKNLISREKVQLLKKKSILINTSRTEITDIQALIEYADENPNFYLGLDIDIDQYSELLAKRRKNVIVTPHIAGYTEEATQRTFIECAEKIVDFIEKTRQEKDRIH